MATSSPSASQPLASLQSQDHADLLNIIDELRSHGISRYVDLPQIIVCGDQSSGKSSVLEAISRIKFPTKDNLCTRFATELILRRSLEESVMVNIVPAPERSDAEKARLEGFSRSEVNLNEFKELVESAKVFMGLDGISSAFTNDVLRVEISGPGQPHLTLVDLPGLFRAGNKTQSDADAIMVKNLVLSYMKKGRSIILAVVSAKNDFANQIVTKYARELDPGGLRTLGLITKPDTLHAGSDSETSFRELAANKDVRFRLGWHVVKNRDYHNRDCSDEERDQSEVEFFSRGSWASLPPSQVGVRALTTRLSSVLKDQILSELPSLISDVQQGVADCGKRLDRLGASRSSITEQRTYLLRISQVFSSLMKESVDGTYSSVYFDSAKTTEGREKRLRSVVQDRMIEFAATMGRDGHARDIMVGSSQDNYLSGSRDKEIRSDYLNEVRDLMKHSRGRELPGTFNPLIVGDLFYEQSQPWKGVVDLAMEEIINAVGICTAKILAYATDSITGEKILRQLIDPALDKIKESLEAMTCSVLQPHQRGHPITYNNNFVSYIQQAKERHFKNTLSSKLTTFFADDMGKNGQTVQQATFDLKSLLSSIGERTQTEMDLYACSEAVHCMQAYYKVALKVLVDNFATLCIENSLLTHLPSIFTPETVINMDDTTIQAIAAEGSESAEERSHTQEKLKILERGLKILKQLNRHRTQANATEVDGELNASTGQKPGNSTSEKGVSAPLLFSARTTTSNDTYEENSKRLKVSEKNGETQTKPEAPKSIFDGVSGGASGIKPGAPQSLFGSGFGAPNGTKSEAPKTFFAGSSGVYSGTKPEVGSQWFGSSFATPLAANTQAATSLFGSTIGQPNEQKPASSNLFG